MDKIVKKRNIDKHLDVKSVNCPLAQLRTKKNLQGMCRGETLYIEANAEDDAQDIKGVANHFGAEVLLDRKVNNIYEFILMNDGKALIKEGSVALVFELGPNGHINVGIKHEDGTVLYVRDAVLPSGLLVPFYNEFSEDLKLLEEMINSPNVRELDLQRFFENHPELLKGNEYDTMIPQAVIYRDGHDSNSTWNPDFILSPIEQESFCKILELKLPSAKTFRSDKNGHHRPYRQLLDAIGQVRDYGKAFNDKSVRRRFYDKYNVDIATPALQLIYGRRENMKAISKIKKLRIDYGVSISSWDALLDKMKREFI